MRLARAGLPVALVAVLSFLLVPSAQAADGGLQMTARLADRDIADFSEGSPLVLRPSQELDVDVEVQNTGDEPVRVRYVRLEGRVLGMTFFRYSVRVDATIDAGATDSHQFALDISDLGEQATGKLPGQLVLLDPDRQVLAAHDVPVDVRGPLTSAYGIFSLLVAVMTALLLIAALARLALGRLTENRWYRATRFAVPGLGLGLTLSFTLSALGVLVPESERSIGLAVGGGLIGLLFGFLTPGPASPGDEEEDPLEAEPARVIDLDAPADRPAAADLPADELPDQAAGPLIAPPPRVSGSRASRDSV